MSWIQVPQYEGLALNEIFEFCDHHPVVYTYLPDKREIHKAPGDWIWNVINTVVPEEFKDWITKQVHLRNERVKSKKNMMIELDPNLAGAFAASTKVSGRCLLHYPSLTFNFPFSVQNP